jgi:hypothetical protein
MGIKTQKIMVAVYDGVAISAGFDRMLMLCDIGNKIASMQLSNNRQSFKSAGYDHKKLKFYSVLLHKK